MRFWVTWSSWRCPCPEQGCWSLDNIQDPFQPKPLYDSVSVPISDSITPVSRLGVHKSLGGHLPKPAGMRWPMGYASLYNKHSCKSCRKRSRKEECSWPWCLSSQIIIKYDATPLSWKCWYLPANKKQWISSLLHFSYVWSFCFTY